MEAKEQKIKEAYGEHWETVKDYVDKKGWLNKRVFQIKDISYEDLNMICLHANGHCLPDCLQGIETNNGWIRIESEADLPKENGLFFVMHKDNKTSPINEFFIVGDMYQENIWMQYFTHYQPITKPNPPIY